MRSVSTPAGCKPAGPSITGVKVYLVQRALGLVGHKEIFDAETTAAVKKFQAANGLEVDGYVGPKTWAKLNTGYDYCVDQFTQQPLAAASATPAQRIEIMIDYAMDRIGKPYIWGGAGPMGFDCSGLDLQAMYAGGRIVPGLNTDLHVGADFRSTQAIYASSLPHYPLSQRKRGDLIFYNSPISHMAIYLGDGKIVEAVRPYIRTSTIGVHGLYIQPQVVRPFPS